jgi:hypothetical protein
MNGSRRRMILAMLAWAMLMQPVGLVHADPRIQFVNPADPLPGDLVAIAGTGFGDRPGPIVVLLVAWPLGSVLAGAEATCRLPIVDWSPNRIRVLASGCPSREYLLAIRDASSEDWVRGQESNAVPLTIRVREGPPAVGVVRGKPQLRRVHPELALPGNVLDVYGDFPFPDPATDRLFLMKSLVGAAPTVPPQVIATLEPLELVRPYLRVRLPEELEPAEYFLVFAKNPVDRSNPLRLVVRSIQPARWEHVSALPGSKEVPFRLVGAVSHVGIERRQLDLLGLNLGSMPGGRGVLLVSATDLEHISWNLRHKDDSDAPLYGIPASLTVVSWSDTRVRLDFGEGNPFPEGTFHLVVSTPGDRWSNSVTVRILPE